MSFSFNRFKRYAKGEGDGEDNDLDYEFAEDFYFDGEYDDYEDYDDMPEDF